MSSQAPSLSKALGTGAQPRLRWLRELWDSTVGKKLVVAVTGLILALYVVLHMLGNLKTLQGPGGGDPAIDRYGEWLRTFGEPVIPRDGMLWAVRVILLAALAVHVVGTAQLIQRNRAARPEGHRRPARLQRSLAARTMAWTGFILLAFIVFHVLQFTTRTIDPTPLAEGAVYANLYGAFQEWWLVAIYVGAMILLGFHLLHALWGATQSHGFDKPNRNPTFRRAATVTAVAVAVGFAAIPISIATGILPEPPGAEATPQEASAR